MQELKSFVCGTWSGQKPGPVLVNPATEESLAQVLEGGFAMGDVVAHARNVGGPALRGLSFAARGALLRKLSQLIHGAREELIALSVANAGTTRGDAKFDIDGSSATLAAYADLGEKLGERHLLADGEPVQLGRSPRLFGQHVLLPREGVAVHVNAFNFPAWGLAEKAACALLAGVPVVSKPATATLLLAHHLVQKIVAAGLLPDGALSLIAGGVGDLLEHLRGQDVLSFTGSGQTATLLRGHQRVVGEAVRVNVEADSLNAAVLGPDAERGSETYGLFIADVARDMTQKTGQKCTAIRRVMVPEDLREAVEEDLIERLSVVKTGDPSKDEVTMGPLATRSQQRDVKDGIARLREDGEALFGGDGAVKAIGVPEGKGFFVGPVLMRAANPAAAKVVHDHEVFGPVASVCAYAGRAAQAAQLVARGGGGLVASAYSDDRRFLRDLVLGIAPYNGRLVIGSSKVAGQAVPPGTVLPQLVHGGPGRAGGGEELGGLRGLAFYQQRTALQGDRALLESITGTGGGAGTGG
jgi:oxepin-CoA hydrolase/3-oxo-5,6-dehydrosuberyl-CoA semialdehyde dehydrogenase